MPDRVFVKRYADLPYDKKEILRFAAAPSASPETLALLDACLAMAQPKISLSLCFARFPANISATACDLGFAAVSSKDLARHLTGCTEIVVFAATAGVGIYQLQQKYTALSPARALMLGAIGTERVEALCDAFCADFAKEASHEGLGTCPRFSPGYGDFPLSFQRKIFSSLHPEKHIGVYLNDHDFMIPPKSVTAVFGLFSKSCGEES